MKTMALAVALFTLSFTQAVQAAEFFCSSGDVTCLIAAINDANQNGEENTINLETGDYTLTAVNNQTIAPVGNLFPIGNGLPVITSVMTLTGAGANQTVIARDSNAPGFRIVFVAGTGALTLDGLTISGGRSGAGRVHRG